MFCPAPMVWALHVKVAHPMMSTGLGHRTSDIHRLNLKMSYRRGLDQVICPIKLSSERSCVLSFLLLRTLRKCFTELHSLFTSSASCYSAASAIHANASSISGPTSTIIDVFKRTSVTKHQGRGFREKKLSTGRSGRC